MAQKLSITFLKDPLFLPGEKFQLEVDSVQQPDLVTPWGLDRAQRGYGWGSMITSNYGVGPSVPYGQGLYGLGLYGQCVRAFTHTSVRAFPSGDYSIKSRALDAAGNAGDWSDAATLEHRPDPPKPTALTVSGGSLTWSWSDP